MPLSYTRIIHPLAILTSSSMSQSVAHNPSCARQNCLSVTANYKSTPSPHCSPTCYVLLFRALPKSHLAHAYVTKTKDLVVMTMRLCAKHRFPNTKMLACRYMVQRTFSHGQLYHGDLHKKYPDGLQDPLILKSEFDEHMLEQLKALAITGVSS